LAVLNAVTEGDYKGLNERAASFAHVLAKAITGGGLRAHVPVVGPLVGLFLAERDSDLPMPVDYMSAKEWAGNGLYGRFFHAMLRRGVALAPGPYEVLFPGLSHDDAVLHRVLDVAADASAEVASLS
jgi:glutamate-1-semialdehyde 2,1-aminomutase